jgi:serine protease
VWLSAIDRFSIRLHAPLCMEVLLMKFASLPIRAAACAVVLSLTSAGALAQSADAPTKRVIVKWKATPAAGAPFATNAAQSQARAVADAGARHGVTLRGERKLATGADLLALDRNITDAEVNDLVANLAANPDVEYAEPDLMMKALLTPNDPRFNEQWHYLGTGGGLNATAAWDVSTGTGAVVAVLDTGYRPHADLAANIIGGYDFVSDTFVANDGNGRDSSALDPGDFTAAGACATGEPAFNSSWHGTHVAGTIAAVTNNGAGVAGVAFGAKVVPVRVLGRCGGSTSDIADAIVWASGGAVSGVPANPNPAKVISLSLGGGGACGATFQNAINSARSRGTTLVIAAGNENRNVSTSSPANCNGVIAIAAVGRTGSKAFYSNFGALVDVAGPGGDTSSGTANGVLSTLNAGATTPGADSYAFYQGTSMATPHVSGVVALMLSKNPLLTPDNIESILKTTARAFPGTCNQCGTGIVNALAAVNAAVGGGGGGGGNQLERPNLSGARNSQQFFTLAVPAGATNLRFQISGGTGDADLYVRFNAQPTTSQWSCRPFVDGNNETCTVAAPAAGTWHVMIRGFAAYSGVTLAGSYTAP